MTNNRYYLHNKGIPNKEDEKVANKVLSIKMDEKDIEKLKKYYETLIKMELLSPQKISLNAFYKHLLLDYLKEDARKALETYENYGMLPRYINPDVLDKDERFRLANTYNLNNEMYATYESCVKEAISTGITRMEENIKSLKEIANVNVDMGKGDMYEIEYISDMEIDEEKASFWDKRVFEMIDLEEKYYKENKIDDEIKMIKNSSISDESKEKLINEIKEHEKNEKRNYSLLQGREIKNY